MGWNRGGRQNFLPEEDLSELEATRLELGVADSPGSSPTLLAL